jgi:hypothetical protein
MKRRVFKRTSIRTTLLSLRRIETTCVTAQHITSPVAFRAAAFFRTIGAPVDGYLARDQDIIVMPGKQAMSW